MLAPNLIKGYLIELKVQEEMLRYGFDISIPSFNSSIYDLIVDTGKEILKLQIKKSRAESRSSFSFSCVSSNGKGINRSKHKYTPNEIDYFATVWKDNVYLIPVDETSQMKTLQLERNKNGNFHEDYLAQNVLQAYPRLSDEELYQDVENTGLYNSNCVICGKTIYSHSKYCKDCYQKIEQTTERPSREELKQLIRTKSFREIGRNYGVSDTAIRKWCDKEKLPRKASDIMKYNDEDWSNI